MRAFCFASSGLWFDFAHHAASRDIRKACMVSEVEPRGRSQTLNAGLLEHPVEDQVDALEVVVEIKQRFEVCIAEL